MWGFFICEEATEKEWTSIFLALEAWTVSKKRISISRLSPKQCTSYGLWSIHPCDPRCGLFCCDFDAEVALRADFGSRRLQRCTEGGECIAQLFFFLGRKVGKSDFISGLVLLGCTWCFYSEGTGASWNGQSWKVEKTVSTKGSCGKALNMYRWYQCVLECLKIQDSGLRPKQIAQSKRSKVKFAGTNS